MNPNEVRKVLKQHLTEDSNIDKVDNIENKKEKIKKEIDSLNNKPETINIEKTGKYLIDIKGLLEEEPIIIQKDGSYTIHLPSIFKMIENENKK